MTRVVAPLFDMTLRHFPMKLDTQAAAQMRLEGDIACCTAEIH